MSSMATGLDAHTSSSSSNMALDNNHFIQEEIETLKELSDKPFSPTSTILDQRYEENSEARVGAEESPHNYE